MRQVISRKVYDTDSAEQIGKHGSIVDKSNFHALAETLYKDPEGEYFLHCQGGAATKYATETTDGTTYGEEIQLLTTIEALNWCENHTIDPDIIIEEFTDLIENANVT